eukprot:UN07618
MYISAIKIGVTSKAVPYMLVIFMGSAYGLLKVGSPVAHGMPSALVSILRNPTKQPEVARKCPMACHTTKFTNAHPEVGAFAFAFSNILRNIPFLASVGSFGLFLFLHSSKLTSIAALVTILKPVWSTTMPTIPKIATAVVAAARQRRQSKAVNITPMT